MGELSIRVPLVTSRTHGIVYRGSDVAGSLRTEPLIINYDVDCRNLKYVQMALLFFALFQVCLRHLT